jgi:cellobiose phosphorylase
MVEKGQLNGWTFIDPDGTFELEGPDRTNHLYFPLVNDALMMSAITPRLHGDIKIDHHHYLTPPVSVFDLHNSRTSRNFFVWMNEKLWSVACNATNQDHDQDETRLEAGILWHRMIRKSSTLGLEAEVTNFVPQVEEQVELMRVKLTNLSLESISFTPVAAIPMFGRSADSLRDHRHVTSLLNRVRVNQYGVVLTPVMSFDERGHNVNAIQYAVLGNDGHGRPPRFIYPSVDGFIGEGGSLDRPLVDFDQPFDSVGSVFLNGYEALGGLRFEDITLAPDESCEFYLLMGIGESLSPEEWTAKFAEPSAFEELFDLNKTYWAKKLNQVQVRTGNKRWDGWTRWVSLQPILRRLMGNSFLPYHDYGRGGRGWRDLWQDALGLLLLESDEIAEMMHAYFAGVRMDGSNATIIGNRPGEFKADRNEIPRVWMDHGVWPLKTLDMYISMTGDYDILRREQTYFKDHLTYRTRQRDAEWCEADSNSQKTKSGQLYQGSIFEHLLVQHLTTFFNAGEHNNLLLEGGDWNDGLDMAQHRGESVAFSAFYAGNLGLLADYADKLIASGVSEVQLASELSLLLDRCFDRVDYDSVDAKQTRLSAYFGAVAYLLTDEKIIVNLEQVKADLLEKSTWLKDQIRKNEWVSSENGGGWFNGYYDDNGDRVEGENSGEVRMTLTGQVFPIMADVATDEQVEEIIKSVNRYLLDDSVGGFRLNTDFKQIQMALGRAFGFAFGHKENGAMFSHMAMMYAYALYQRGYPEAGYSVMEKIYQHCQNFAVSRMYPGIPEYIGQDGRGYYFYLTGSASWYMFTLITQVFGVRGVDGDLLIEPKLVPEQFDQEGIASIHSHFAGRQMVVEVHNVGKLPVGQYKIKNARIDEVLVAFETMGNGAKISRNEIEKLSPDDVHKIKIELG